jgi:hypothetical protein
MSFTLPQFGIFAQGTDAHHFLEFDLRPGVTPTDAMASFRRLRAPFFEIDEPVRGPVQVDI